MKSKAYYPGDIQSVDEFRKEFGEKVYQQWKRTYVGKKWIRSIEEKATKKTMKDSDFSVDELIHERGLRYGHPARFFRQLAKAWSGVVDVDLTPQQCCLMMVLFKNIRLYNNTDDDDTQKDIKGYLKILEIINEFEK